MKLLKNSNSLLILFLVGLTVLNLIQAASTELLADEAYYWTYSNFLDWGYFDHPPMVAIWISISKLFFSSGELSVRFFSTLTLSVNFYLVWLLIKHPQKKNFTWLFILIVLTTSLFNVYGFITVPDTPLLFFMAIFLLGYQKYLQKKSLLSYVILSISMAGMMYSKYQAALIIIFVLLSNLSLLRDYKLWITVFSSMLLFFPHLFWQYSNDFPSFKYHLFERASRQYRIDFTTNHFLNLIAIIGFTFPIVYFAFYKNLKNKDYFNKSLNYIVLGFFLFFFFSSFKNHVQAQWIAPISIPLIIITFNFLVENNHKIKLFKILAFITIGITLVLRLIMANDGLIPHQLEMHGNKKWVQDLHTQLKGSKPLFRNSYQNTSLYWFYSGERPCQYNTWYSRKNQFDLFDYNKNCGFKNMVEIGVPPNNNYVVKQNNNKLYFSKIAQHNNNKNIYFSFKEPLQIKLNKENFLKVNTSLFKESIVKHSLNLKIMLRNKNKEIIKNPINNSKFFDASLKNNTIVFLLPKLNKKAPKYLQVIGNVSRQTVPVRMSTITKCIVN